MLDEAAKRGGLKLGLGLLVHRKPPRHSAYCGTSTRPLPVPPPGRTPGAATRNWLHSPSYWLHSVAFPAHFPAAFRAPPPWFSAIFPTIRPAARRRKLASFRRFL